MALLNLLLMASRFAALLPKQLKCWFAQAESSQPHPLESSRNPWHATLDRSTPTDQPSRQRATLVLHPWTALHNTSVKPSPSSGSAPASWYPTHSPSQWRSHCWLLRTEGIHPGRQKGRMDICMKVVFIHWWPQIDSGPPQKIRLTLGKHVMAFKRNGCHKEISPCTKWLPLQGWPIVNMPMPWLEYFQWRLSCPLSTYSHFLVAVIL